MLLDPESYQRPNFFQRLNALWQWSKNPLGSYFGNYLFNRTAPVLVNCEDLMTPFRDCPHLNLVISEKAKMFSDGEWKCIDLKDPAKEYADDEGLILLNNPNPIQNRAEFLKQYILEKDIFAHSFIYKLSGTAITFPSALWHLPSDFMKIKWTGKMYKQTKIEEIIKNFLLCESGQEIPYEVGETMFKIENFDRAKQRGISKIISLKLPISNIIASLTTRNIIATEKGMIGILSNESKDASGTSIMDPAEKERIENDFRQRRGLYGAGSKISISGTALRWNAMSFPTRDLMLFEENEEDFGTILGAYGMDRDIFPSTKGATNENKRQGLISTYQNTILPEAKSFAEMISKGLGAIEKGRKYILDYSHVPALQEDRETKANVLQKNVTAVQNLVQANIINPLQAQEIIQTLTVIKINEKLKSTNPLIDKLTELSPLIANNMLGNITINEVREILGLGAVPGGDQLAKLTALTQATGQQQNNS